MLVATKPLDLNDPKTKTLKNSGDSRSNYDFTFNGITKYLIFPIYFITKSNKSKPCLVKDHPKRNEKNYQYHQIKL